MAEQRYIGRIADVINALLAAIPYDQRQVMLYANNHRAGVYVELFGEMVSTEQHSEEFMLEVRIQAFHERFLPLRTVAEAYEAALAIDGGSPLAMARLTAVGDHQLRIHFTTSHALRPDQAFTVRLVELQTSYSAN